ncbi:hypothetical protein M0802_001619 [Mischocyttarus mexicanus]|nr:hypothetical protein M0802_001619 [Mischocyttarus mexicanus]
MKDNKRRTRGCEVEDEGKEEKEEEDDDKKEIGESPFLDKTDDPDDPDLSRQAGAFLGLDSWKSEVLCDSAYLDRCAAAFCPKLEKDRQRRREGERERNKTKTCFGCQERIL